MGRNNKIKVKFLGAAQTVTGSRTLVTYNGNSVLIDCGLFQGPKEMRMQNWETMPDLDKVDVIVLTHAHIDHSGYLPKVVKEGYSGPIYCTPPTQELCKVMLLDSAHLQEEDANFALRKRHSSHLNPLPFYTEKDAIDALNLFESRDYEKWHNLFEDISVRFVRSGHILGSSFVQLSFQTENGIKILTFSGDIGHSRQFVIRSPDPLLETDYLVLESTYGDRRHPKVDTLKELEQVINNTYNKGGILVIPAFAVGRTQEILYMIRALEEQKRIPIQPVYLDSPMANKATSIYKNFPNELKMKLKGENLESALCSSRFNRVSSADDSMLLCMKDD